ncbi:MULTISPECIES: hypothetical protein [unclassified Sphingomonas]|uniref:hypothetical protein n=1 Tax=unclassified Sphingomonas TaxID=196159 RepID=UPI001F58A03B|nr:MULTISPECIES: hypothetical protein [unclassified Sphingomonas]
MRPPSIVNFERCYLGSFAIWLLNTLAFWPALTAAMRANPAVARLSPAFAPTVLGIGIVLVSAITLLLWYFTARTGSLVAKWIVTIFFAFSAIPAFYGLAVAMRPMTPQGIGNLVSIALNAVAVWMLFRADARLWFAARNADVPVGRNEEMPL